jgi:DNA transformation protein
MDRDFLIDLFAEFGPVSLRRMFSGYGVSVDGINFALVLRGVLYFRADQCTIALFEDEGSRPFQYQTRAKVVTVGSYWQLPERLYDDPTELAQWANAALGAAERAAAAKHSKRRGVKAKTATAKKPGGGPAKSKVVIAKPRTPGTSTARAIKVPKSVAKAASTRVKKR